MVDDVLAEGIILIPRPGQSDGFPAAVVERGLRGIRRIGHGQAPAGVEVVDGAFGAGG
jgi:hypothetical protein